MPRIKAVKTDIEAKEEKTDSKKARIVGYISRDEEPGFINVTVGRRRWHGPKSIHDNRVRFLIPVDEAEFFELSPLFVNGRLVRED